MGEGEDGASMYMRHLRETFLNKVVVEQTPKRAREFQAEGTVNVKVLSWKSA